MNKNGGGGKRAGTINWLVVSYWNNHLHCHYSRYSPALLACHGRQRIRFPMLTGIKTLLFRDYNAEKDAWGDQCESLKLLNCKISCPRVTSCSQVFNNHMCVYCLVSFLSLDLTEYFWVVDKTRHLEDVILCFGNQISLFGAFCRTNNKSINQLQL